MRLFEMNSESDIDRFIAGSVVVNSDGTPKKVYHGTNVHFDKFDPNMTAQGILWFTDKVESIKNGDAGALSSKIIRECYLNIKNPAGWKEYDQLMLDEIRSRGFDGIILPYGDENYYIAFNADQVWIDK